MCIVTPFRLDKANRYTCLYITNKTNTVIQKSEDTNNNIDGYVCLYVKQTVFTLGDSVNTISRCSFGGVYMVTIYLALCYIKI